MKWTMFAIYIAELVKTVEKTQQPYIKNRQVIGGNNSHKNKCKWPLTY